MADDTPWVNSEALRGIDKLWSGGCDRVVQFPKDPAARAAILKAHQQMVAGLLAAYEKRPRNDDA